MTYRQASARLRLACILYRISGNRDRFLAAWRAHKDFVHDHYVSPYLRKRCRTLEQAEKDLVK